MTLALDHLHNGLDKRYIHNDFKPQNVLAFKLIRFAGKDGLPKEPRFKVSDFAHLTPFPTPISRCPKGFDGTYEYTQPKQEQPAPILPLTQSQSLGATLQYMALGVEPIQSREAFIGAGKVLSSRTLILTT